MYIYIYYRQLYVGGWVGGCASEFLGARNTYDLKEGGSEIPVTGDNVAEFVDLYLQHVLYIFSAKALTAFLAGFHSLIPPWKVKDFLPHELEAVMCGQPEITDKDVEQLRAASHCSLDPSGRPHAQVLLQIANII
jgi:hypothetical protein